MQVSCPGTRVVEDNVRRFIALIVTALAVAVGAPASASPMPPPLPKLDVAQATRLADRMKLYRIEVEGRVSRGDITAAEAERLLAWREWQIARQIAGLAPPKPAYITPNYAPRAGESGVPPDYRPVAPAPYVYSIPYPVYAPWPAYPWPYGWYGSPWPAITWGATLCGGGYGHHFRFGACL